MVSRFSHHIRAKSLHVSVYLLPLTVTYCDGEFTTGNQVFTSPNYPNPYPDYSSCKTTITAPSGSQVLVRMEDFMLEADCNADSLTVYDSADVDDDNLIGEFCGETFPEYIKSSGQSLHFVFKSDGLVQQTGFSADFSFVPGLCVYRILQNTLLYGEAIATKDPTVPMKGLCLQLGHCNHTVIGSNPTEVSM